MLRLFTSVTVGVVVVAVLLAGGHILFFLTAELFCDTAPPSQGFAGCAGIDRGHDASWGVALVLGAAVATLLIAVSRGWLRSRTGALIASIGPVMGIFMVVGASSVWSYSVDSICHPDGAGGCLEFAIPPGERLMFATVWCAIGAVLSSAAVALGRRVPPQP